MVLRTHRSHDFVSKQAEHISLRARLHTSSDARSASGHKVYSGTKIELASGKTLADFF